MILQWVREMVHVISLDQVYIRGIGAQMLYALVERNDDVDLQAKA